ncbi:MAG: DNA-deoxyinosine glycosylase [Pseudohongiellaceae bacterium]
MANAQSFPPLATPDARILILGSMPGQASLQAQQYYAHPRNAFWYIMGELFGAGPELPYEQRCAVLVAKGVAVWDVLKHCWRPGSLDTSIDPSSVEANDFPRFLADHPDIRHVFFNGRKAEQTFTRHVTPALEDKPPQCMMLPSTSPAHAAMSREEKCNAWSVIASVR